MAKEVVESQFFRIIHILKGNRTTINFIRVIIYHKMEKKKFCKIITGLAILIAWIILLTGLFVPSVFVWLLLIIITAIFYLSITKRSYRRRKSIQDVVADMDDYMERKAEERLGKAEKQEKSEDEEDRYDFDDDIEIIKK